jgi:hypothetical protein
LREKRRDDNIYVCMPTGPEQGGEQRQERGEIYVAQEWGGKVVGRQESSGRRDPKKKQHEERRGEGKD